MGWDWDWYPKAKPRRPADGIKARTGRGQKFGQTWWAGKWIAALEQLVDRGRLERGRSYARGGQVLNLDVGPGRVNSRVQGSRPAPYKVHVQIKALSDQAWEKVTDAMAVQALFAAKLLAGEMPPNIEEAFTAAGVSLFPDTGGDLETDCSCPDYSNPCKHIAAVYYLMGERFDDDPFVLFQLRGRTKDQIISALRARRTAGAEPAPAKREPGQRLRRHARVEPIVHLADSLEHFWEAGPEIDELRFSIAAPEVEAAPVKQLGEPSFWKGQTPFLEHLGAAYAAATQAALNKALGNERAEERAEDRRAKR
jgi:uncharacterized Zn finger protein